MKIILFCLVANILICNTYAQSMVSSQEESVLSGSIYEFSTNLLVNCVTSPNENIVLSPLSAQVILGLAYAGSGGATAQAMQTGLDLTGETQPQATQNFHNLMSSLTQVTNGTILNIANKIYIADNYEISSTFQTTATAFYSSIETIDFTASVSAAAEINAWAAMETNNKIQDVVSPDELNSLTRLMLVNAIYFKGLWANPFDQYATSPAAFYTSTTSSQITSATSNSQVQMMYTQNTYNYAVISAIDAAVIELPYQDPSLSMMILLPNALDGLAALETSLTKYTLQMITNQLISQKVNVYIPKFTINFNINLNSALNQMGMGIMFSDFADFSGILSNDEALKISSVIQKAYIEVDEQGAEAAAVTTVLIEARVAFIDFSPSFIPTFYANYPFIFILKKNKDALFIGSFSN